MRVRFAPSPTGYLHLGNARTALFNYLLARQQKGSFVLRIEDTDRERSRPEFERMILEDLQWLGLDWDEGPDRGGPHAPYRQSERIQAYRERVDWLISEGKAYHCYCSFEELEGMRREQTSRKESPRYDNRCRELTAAQKAAYQREGRRPTVRFRIPDRSLTFFDLIRGDITFDTSLMGDLIIMKSDGLPSFHLAVVLDDIDMEISHVVRGEDHISNTPRHILLFEAFNRKPPSFAHMAMTLGPDGKRLSKRHGATSVRELRNQGYLPEAVFNYLALLGWGINDDQEVFSRQELIDRFSLDRCKEGAAIFDQAKLTWLNGLYMQKKGPDRITELALPYLQEAGLAASGAGPEERTRLARIVGLIGDRVKKLNEIPEAVAIFVRETVDYDPAAVEKVLRKPGVAEILAGMLPLFEAADDFSAGRLEALVREFCQARALKTGQVFHPVRVAATGRTVGPGLFELLEVLGREKVLRRLRRAVEFLASGEPPAAGTGVS